MTPKVQILTRCRACDGQAYVFERIDHEHAGEPYERFTACPACQGSGSAPHWVTLPEFADLLDRALALEPDWEELGHEEPISQIQDSRAAAGF